MKTQTTKKDKTKTGQNGTMSFIDHLDELRTRLLRFLVVLTLCVLVTYAFRKEILDIVRMPVDIPLKKYTDTAAQRTSKSKKPLSLLNSYNCVCQEAGPVSSDSSIREDDQAKVIEQPVVPADDMVADENLVDQLIDADKIEEAKKWLVTLRDTVNDFIVFFQVMLGKEPSPIFDSSDTDSAPESDQAWAETASMPDSINLNCTCTVDSSARKAAPSHSTMVYIGLPELFFAQMKVAIFSGLFLAFPYLLIELWGFVGPALYRGERKVFWIFAISSYIFFIGGALFGYFVVFPLGFDFFLSLTQIGEIMPSLSIGEYLSFAIKLLLAFGLIFELPLITFILARMGIVTPEMMIKQARIAILVVFIVSAVLTPPDPLTMLMMSVPMILLYILSIGVCFVGVNRQKAALRKQGLEFDGIDTP